MEIIMNNKMINYKACLANFQTLEMDAYFERIKSNAENIAKNVFPKKALELDDIINVSSLMKC